MRQGSVQLLVTAGRETEEFLEAHGEVVADIAFACDDAVRARDAAVAAGPSLISSEPGRHVVSGLFGANHSLVARSIGSRAPAG